MLNIQCNILVGRIIDTHTAVAVAVSRHFNRNDRPMLILSTAHYSKFPDVIANALGLTNEAISSDPIKVLDKLSALDTNSKKVRRVIDSLSKPCVHKETVGADVDLLKQHIMKFVQK